MSKSPFGMLETHSLSQHTPSSAGGKIQAAALECRYISYTRRDFCTFPIAFRVFSSDPQFVQKILDA